MRIMNGRLTFKRKLVTQKSPHKSLSWTHPLASAAEDVRCAKRQPGPRMSTLWMTCNKWRG